MLNIYAVEYISLSEISTVYPHVNKEWVDNNIDKFQKMLFELGMDIYNFPAEEQYCTHRNRFGNIVTDYRYVGNSRLDSEWVQSGYASQEAMDKSLNNRLLVDLYRSRGMCEVE